MFREYVSSPIEPITKEYVSSIKRIGSEPDYSLTCVGIAMLKPRIENYDGIVGCYSSYSYKNACLQNFVDRVKTIDTHPLFCFYKYTSDDTASYPDYIKEYLGEFKEKKSIAEFVKEKMNYSCQVLYHEKKNAVCICVNSPDMRLYHLLLSFISLYYPSLFKDKPLAENDYNLIKSLSKKDRNDFHACIKKLVFPFAIEMRKAQLCGFLKQIHSNKISNALTGVENQRRTVQAYERQYVDAIAALNNLIVEYEGMKVTENYDKAEEDLVEYLSTNENVHDISFNNSRLNFNVTTLLSNYNEHAWELFSERGYIYDGDYNARLSDVFKSKDNRKILLDSIFSDDPKLMVRMAGNYSLDMGNCRIMTNDNYDYETVDPIFKSYLPNPHLKLFACLGGYSNRVMRALQDRNYIGAIELCIASAGSVNLDETTQVFRPFLGWILTSTQKILVTKDGTEMTPEEALVWLIDKEKKNETN